MDDDVRFDGKWDRDVQNKTKGKAKERFNDGENMAYYR